LFYIKLKWGMRMQKDLTTLEETFKALGLSEMHHEDMTVLVKSGEEMNDFMSNYWIEQDKQFESINAYRDSKINCNQMDYETFKDIYLEKDKVAALEGLFWHKVHKSHVRMLEKRFTSGTLDLKQVYDWHKENKKSRLLGLVLSTAY
jgi:hypothetical protein